MPFANLQGKHCFSVNDQSIYEREKGDTKYNQNKSLSQDVMISQTSS